MNSSWNVSFLQLALGFVLAAAIASLAWRARSLSGSGAWAAMITGAILFGLGGLPWTSLLLAFFISSSALSRAFASQKASLSEKFSKGSQRDWGQVLANGGLGAILVIFQAAMPQESWPWIAFAGAMATVNADTWATEVGVLNPKPPRLITSGKTVERGTSGAVSQLGSLAALGGAFLIAAIGALFPEALVNTNLSSVFFLLATTIGGLAGAFFDSFLGATLQAIYWCPDCQKETERYPVHLCGAATSRYRGWFWLDNDVVNFIASGVGGLVALGLWRLFN